MDNKNDNSNDTPREDLREYAIDSTLDRLDMLANAIESPSKTDEVVIGTRSLSQFMGIGDGSLKKQLFDQSSMEQDFITGRYIERLRSSGSLSDAGRDLANCLTYGTDYDLKIANMPRPQFTLAMQPPTPSMGGMGPQSMGLPPGYNYTVPPNITPQSNNTGERTPLTQPFVLPDEEDE